MLRSIDTLQKGFRKVAKQSKEECSEELEKMRKFVFVMKRIEETFLEFLDAETQRYFDSLAYVCYLELLRTSGHILFLSCSGLYRNAFDNIRYALESIVQAVYIDIRHPNTEFKTKIEILKEVEDKREYHAVRLIDELKIDFKDRLKKEYKQLSRIIHPTHEQPVSTVTDILEDRGVPVTINCEEISKIYDSMKRMYDIFFFLLFTYFSEVKEALKKDPNFIKDIKGHKMVLLSNLLRVWL